MLFLNKLPQFWVSDPENKQLHAATRLKDPEHHPCGPRTPGKILSLSVTSEKLATKIPASGTALNAHPRLTVVFAGAHNTTNFPRTKVNQLVFGATVEKTHFKPLLWWGILLKTLKHVGVNIRFKTSFQRLKIEKKKKKESNRDTWKHI